MIRPIQPRNGVKPAQSETEGHLAPQGQNHAFDLEAVSSPKQLTQGLGSLTSQEEVRIDSLLGPETLKRRLMEIGFVPGSAVRFEMATPFGDPLVFSLRGSKIALRRNEAECVRFTR